MGVFEHYICDCWFTLQFWLYGWLGWLAALAEECWLQLS